MIYLMTKTKREEFRNTDTFKAIMQKINELYLNSSYTVGNIKEFISKYSTYDEWRKGYFESGEERKDLLANIDSITRKANTDYSYNIHWNKEPREYVPYINVEYGRTKEDLCEFAEILKKDFEEMELPYTLEEIFAVVYMYVIQIPWEEKERG